VNSCEIFYPVYFEFYDFELCMLYFDICMCGILHLLAVIVKRVSSEIPHLTGVSPFEQVSIGLETVNIYQLLVRQGITCC